MLPRRYEFLANDFIVRNITMYKDKENTEKKLALLEDDLSEKARKLWNREREGIISSLFTTYAEDEKYTRDQIEYLKERYRFLLEYSGKDASGESDKQIERATKYLPAIAPNHKWPKSTPNVGDIGYISKGGMVSVGKFKAKLPYLKSKDGFLVHIGNYVFDFLDIWKDEPDQALAEVLIEQMHFSPNQVANYSGVEGIYHGAWEYGDDVVIVECFSGPFNNQIIMGSSNAVDVILTDSEATARLQKFGRAFPEGLYDVFENNPGSKFVLLITPPRDENVIMDVLETLGRVFDERDDVIAYVGLAAVWNVFLEENMANIIKSFNADWNYIHKGVFQMTNKNSTVKILGGQIYPNTS